MTALTELGERKREQGETAALDLGTILEEIEYLDAEAVRRLREETQKQEEREAMNRARKQP
jgi:hypothetical protein